MEIDFLEYKVRTGDTLSSIAYRVGITDEELKLFHNARCQSLDKIWFEDLYDVKTIFVPIDFKPKLIQKQTRKKIFSSHLSESFFAKTYIVNETFESRFESPFTIRYMIELGLYQDKTNGQYILSYQQKDFNSEGNIPDDKASSLSMASMRSIMPLKFILNEKGKITRFEDHKSMIETFLHQRKELEDFYIGDVSQNYMDTFERSIQDEPFLLQQLQSTLLFQTLFPGMEWFQKETKWKEPFYFLQNSFPVQCEMNREQLQEDDHSVLTVFNGKIIESCTLQEILRGIKLKESPAVTASGSIRFEYCTHAKNRDLLRAGASVLLSYEEADIHQHHINITQGSI